MADCTKANALGGFIADAEMSGKDVSEMFGGMKLKERMGYAGRSSSLHARGSKEDYPDLHAEIEKIEAEKGIRIKPSAVAFFRHADKLIPEQHTKAIGEAVDSWKKQSIDNNLTQPEARKLWHEVVRPVAEEQEKAYKQTADAMLYKKQRVQNYFDDMKGGEWMFGGTDNPIATVARRGAGFLTGYDMTIAMYDMFELLYKGVSVHDPVTLTRGVANTLWKGKVGKAFGRMDENKPFYASLDFAENSATGRMQLGKKLDWLMDHLNPQYYSNNFLVNVAAEMGRISGKGAADSVEKIAFIPKLENTPEYMRRGMAEMTWARYGTEAFKYYLDMHAGLGRAVISKDPKAFVGSMAQLTMWYGLTSAITGTRTWSPPIIGDFIAAATKNDNEDDIFDQMDQIPVFNLVEKATNMDLSKSLRISAPLYGLAYSNSTSQVGKLESTGTRILKAIQGDDPAQAIKIGLEAAFLGTALRFGVNPITNKSTKEWLDLAIDYHSGDIDAEEAARTVQENVFGKQVVNK